MSEQKMREALELAILTMQRNVMKDCKHGQTSGLYAAIFKCQEALAAPSGEQRENVELPPIYYMRDNHTFRRLSDYVRTALVEIEAEFNAGWTNGTLCSKRTGFKPVHAEGSTSRIRFFKECEEALIAAHEAKRNGGAA